MKQRSNNRKGSAMVEFTLVAIPLIFVLISVFEMARGMWVYHTLAYALKEGARFAMVKGQNCATAPNACSVTVADVANRIRNAGVGLIPSELSLTLVSGTSTVNCQLDGGPSACVNNATQWPATGANDVGMDIQISGVYPFRSALAMFWPGTGRGVSFGTVNFPASSRENIQF
jgi:Flp pilus assembly protein TadG